jgi:hypothetical protein
MKSRFNFFDGTPKDIFEHASEIEIRLLRFRGRLGIEFKVSGGYIPNLDDKEDGTQEPDAAVLADDLLRRFVAAKSPGGEL